MPARLISPDPNDPNLGIYEDENGEPFIAPLVMQPGLAEESQPQQMAAPAQPAEGPLVYEQTEPPTQPPMLAENGIGRDVAANLLGDQAADFGLGTPAPTSPVQTVENTLAGTEQPTLEQFISASEAALANTPVAGPSDMAARPLEVSREQARSLPPDRTIEPGAPGASPTNEYAHLDIDETTAAVLRARGINPFQVERAVGQGVGVGGAGTHVTFAEQQRQGGGRRGQPALPVSTLSGTAVPGELINRMESAVDQSLDAQGQLAGLEEQYAGEAANIHDEVAAREAEETAQLEQLTQQRIAETETAVADVQGFLQQMANTRINPDRFFTDRGEASRFGAAVSIAAGTMAQVLAPGTQNAAMAIIDSAIERDMQAQLANMQNAQASTQAGLNLLGQLRAFYNDERAAALALRTIRLQDAQNRLQGIALRHRSAAAYANYQQAAAEIEHRQAMTLAEFQKRVFELTEPGAMGRLAVINEVQNIEARPPMQPEAQRITQLPDTAIGAAKDGERPITDIEDPLYAQQEAQHAQRLIREAGGGQPVVSQPRVARGGQQRRPRQQDVSVQHGQVIGNAKELFGNDPQAIIQGINQLEAALPAGFILGQFVTGPPGNRDITLQVQRLGASTAPREETVAIGEREMRQVAMAEPSHFLVPIDPNRARNLTESQRNRLGKLHEIPAHLVRVRELLRLAESPRVRIEGSHENGVARELYQQLLPGLQALADSGVLNEGERVYFTEERLADVRSALDSIFRGPAATAQLRTHIREVERQTNAIAHGLGHAYVSPSFTGATAERDNPGEPPQERREPEPPTDVFEAVVHGVSSVATPLVGVLQGLRGAQGRDE